MQRFAQPTYQIHRGRIRRLAPLKSLQRFRQVEIVARVCACFGTRLSLLAEGHKSQPGRQHQGLLRGTDYRIETVFIHVYRRSADNADCVHDGEYPGICGDLPQTRQVLLHACGGFVVDDTESLKRDLMQEAGQQVRISGLIGAALPPGDAYTIAAGDLAHASSELAGVDHQYAITRRQQIGHRRLGRSSAGSCQHGHRAGCPQKLLQACVALTEKLGKLRPTVVYGRPGDGLSHCLRYSGRAGYHQ